MAKDRKANFIVSFAILYSSISYLPFVQDKFVYFVICYHLLSFTATACRVPQEEHPGQGVQEEGDLQGAAHGLAVRGGRAQELVNTIKLNCPRRGSEEESLERTRGRDPAKTP